MLMLILINFHSDLPSLEESLQFVPSHSDLSKNIEEIFILCSRRSMQLGQKDASARVWGHLNNKSQVLDIMCQSLAK